MEFICFINIFYRYGKNLLESFLKKHEMGMVELIILLVLNESPGYYQSKLIHFTGLEKGNFSKLLKQLELKDLIYRVENPTLIGQNQCYLSKKGEALIPELLEIVQGWQKVLIEEISEEDLKIFSGVSLKISGNLMKSLGIKWS